MLRNARQSYRRRSVLESSLRARASDDSTEDRVILMLHAWDGLDTHAVQTTLSITNNAAAVRLSRAQERFCEALNTARVTGNSPATQNEEMP